MCLPTSRAKVMRSLKLKLSKVCLKDFVFRLQHYNYYSGLVYFEPSLLFPPYFFHQQEEGHPQDSNFDSIIESKTFKLI